MQIIILHGVRPSYLYGRFYKPAIVWKRLQSSEVRVRFAPSPTGFLHLGGLRTALYNYLFAHGQEKRGKFILRIEDTDRTRLVPGAVDAIIEDLQWVGIEIDEGPIGTKGSLGPYIQSERTSIYLKYMEDLLNNGSAYRCFCSERRLELLRKEAIRRREVPKYDNKCRHLTKENISEFLSQNKSYCVRFKLHDYEEPWNDMIYGQIQHNVKDTEGDPIIIKSDHYPTYHFANVVDDHLMNITHVLRGVEWQISTTKHLLLYRAFGWKPPIFGHLPLLVNADGTKLSKRQGDIDIKSLRMQGYLPNALLNYVVSAGGGFPHQQFAKPSCYNFDELIKKFNISAVNSSPSRLNPTLLDNFNRMEIKKHLECEATANKLVKNTKQLLLEKYSKSFNLDLDDKHIKDVLKWSANRLTFIQDLITPKFAFIWIKPEIYDIPGITKEQIKLVIDELDKCEQFDKDHLTTIMKKIAQQQNIKFPLLMKSLRTSLSGIKEGPGVSEMMEIVGKRMVLKRLKNVFNKIK